MWWTGCAAACVFVFLVHWTHCVHTVLHISTSLPLQVMSWFADCPSPQAPFSMHALMDQAVRHDNHPGDWFGPSQVSVIMRYGFTQYTNYTN